MNKAIVMNETARIEGDPKQVMLFGLAYVQSLDPIGWANDERLPQWLAQWADGAGVFSTSTESGGEEAFRKASSKTGSFFAKELSRKECEELIDMLSDQYRLDGMILDLTNGWVLRDARGTFVANGKDRVTGFLCDRAAARK